MASIPLNSPVGKTSIGSVLAAAGGIVGTVTPFIPVQWQWLGATFAAILGTFATALP